MASQPKKLYRSKSNRWIGGVCGGLGDYFNVDPTAIRLLFVLASLLLGAVVGGIIVYAIMWILIPEEPAQSGEASQ
jgi:phage shock protein C